MSNIPQAWPESDHLARCIFLKAGGVVDSCTFDDVIALVEEVEDVSCGVHSSGLATKTYDDGAASPAYLPLSTGRSIRLLVVEPGNRDEDLRTTLDEVSLNDSPKYEAVSYSWGSLSNKTNLKCGNSRILIPTNLEQALKRIRLPHLRRQVWADAVCINQDDLEERNQQVSIMRIIFQSAERVLAWLGHVEDDRVSNAFTAVCSIVRSWRPKGDKYEYASYAEALEPNGGNETMPNIDVRAWTCLKALFETDYFRRFWVIQELVVSSSATLFWGEHHIAWPLVGITAAWLMTRGWNYHHGIVSEPITAAYNAFLIYVLPLAKYSGISRFSKLDLAVVLGTTRERFASTDARDRIYALLGIPFAGNDPERSLLISPNYGENIRSVYLAAARQMIRQDKHFRILSAVQHGPNIDTTFPSWVPRWDEMLYAEPMGFRAEQGYYANAGELFFPDDQTFGLDGESLIVTGLQCATVMNSSEEMTKGNLTLDAFSEGRDEQAWRSIVTNLTNEMKRLRSSWTAAQERFILLGFTDPDYQETGDHHAGTITNKPGRYFCRDASKQLDGESVQLDHLGEFLLYWRERASWNIEDLQHNDFSGYWEQAAKDPYVLERTLCAFNTLPGRRIFYSDDGKFGLGPTSIRAGDVIVVLFGGIVPFVLRPLSDERWQLVGECFVPSLMQGEAVEAAGLFEERVHSRNDDGLLELYLGSENGRDPRYRRVVGEHGIRKFEIR